MNAKEKMIEVKIPSSAGKDIAWIYKNSEVISIENKEEYQLIRAKISLVNQEKLNKKYKIKIFPEVVI